MIEGKTLSLQQQYASNSICFGCGPANKDGLHINSFPEGDTLVCDWTPEPKYQAFPGALYGGLVGSLLDCHCNWTASWHLMKQNGLDKPPATVTAEYTVKFMKPTPSDRPLRLVARVVQAGERKASVEGQLLADGEVCATCTATFIAVKPGHPAYGRW
ncbi:MAG TPA: PaaI family thioesterase [Candidatus Obscuribacterales bacterium]